MVGEPSVCLRAPPWFTLPGGRPLSEPSHVLGRQRLAADAPVAALDLFDDAPRDAAHVLALDRDHGLRELLDDLALLMLREHTLDYLDVQQWHGFSFFLCIWSRADRLIGTCTNLRQPPPAWNRE